MKRESSFFFLLRLQFLFEIRLFTTVLGPMLQEQQRKFYEPQEEEEIFFHLRRTRRWKKSLAASVYSLFSLPCCSLFFLYQKTTTVFEWFFWEEKAEKRRGSDCRKLRIRHRTIERKLTFRSVGRRRSHSNKKISSFPQTVSFPYITTTQKTLFLSIPSNKNTSSLPPPKKNFLSSKIKAENKQ